MACNLSGARQLMLLLIAGQFRDDQYSVRGKSNDRLDKRYSPCRSRTPPKLAQRWCRSWTMAAEVPACYLESRDPLGWFWLISAASSLVTTTTRSSLIIPLDHLETIPRGLPGGSRGKVRSSATFSGEASKYCRIGGFYSRISERLERVSQHSTQWKIRLGS
jgi:hypothetical protein